MLTRNSISVALGYSVASLLVPSAHAALAPQVSCNTADPANVLRSTSSMQAFDLNPGGAGHSTALDPIPWDFDSDGDEDLVVASSTNNILLLRNEGAGTGQFTDVTNQVFNGASFNGLARPIVQAGDTGDMTGDGIDDLVIATNLLPAGGSGIWIVEGRSGLGQLVTTTIPFVDEAGAPSNGPWLGGAARFTGLVLADVTTDTPAPMDAAPGLAFDLDGRLDVIVTRGVTSLNTSTIPYQNLPGALLIGAGTASGPFLDVSPALPASQAPATPNWLPLPDSNWSDPLVEDLDGDDRPDIWVTGSGGVNGFEIYGYDYVWQSSAFGAGPADRFVLVPGALAGPAASQSGFNKVPIDFDQDGDLDVVTNRVGQISVRINASTPGAIAFGPSIPAAVLACRNGLVAHSSLEVGDFNQDGLDDIVEVNGTFLAGVPGGLVQIDNGMDIELVAGQVNIGLPVHGVTSDFDNDGDQDIVYTSGSEIAAFADWSNLLDGPQVATPATGGNATAVYDWPNLFPGYMFVATQEAAPHVNFPLAPTVGQLAVSSPVIVFVPGPTYTLTLPDMGGTVPVFVQFWDVFNPVTPQVTNVVRTMF